MKTIHHDKLVRDLIPDIILEAGKSPVTEEIPADHLPDALDAKLREEVQEFLESHSPEEMADILEVLHGIAFHRGIPWDEIEQLRLQKRSARGGFEKGIRLIDVICK